MGMRSHLFPRRHRTEPCRAQLFDEEVRPAVHPHQRNLPAEGDAPRIPHTARPPSLMIDAGVEATRRPSTATRRRQNNH
eukprot:3079393-Pyramimonas_sp.AAC.1